MKKKVEGRLVRIEKYEEGGFKITTTQKEDDPGEVIQDDSDTTIISPTEAGREIRNRGTLK